MRNATIDTNIIGHLYRCKAGKLMTNLFEVIFVDEMILIELQKNCSDIYDEFYEDVINTGSCYKLVTGEILKDQNLYSVYEAQLKDYNDLFFPQDEGEKRAIVLGQTFGAFYLLTDDQKYMDGPAYMIQNEIIKDMESLAFWELIFLNVLCDYISFDQAKEYYDIISNKGFTDGYKPDFTQKTKQAVRRLSKQEWFRLWIKDQNIPEKRIADYLRYAKSIELIA
ncbi:hypothetical protein [Gracilibacillus lacisalsi]|uniref:hypothetical protein n=1 Tax=Gracilibacillus lacisalsi TaxID=393087 RepID=UPI0003825012|nr:hypothetical protein [Gracilibacillus lacisalsi]